MARTPSNLIAAKISSPAMPRLAAISHKARSPTCLPSSIQSGIAIALTSPIDASASSPALGSFSRYLK